MLLLKQQNNVFMKIDVDLPKFDIPKDFIVGDGITGDILNMYGLFPCKIKAGVHARDDPCDDKPG